MDHIAIYLNTYVRYHASDMLLTIYSDAAYLVVPKARSRVAGYFQMNNTPSNTKHPTINGAVLVQCKTLRHVVSSAAEAKTAGIFDNAQTAIPIRTHFARPQSSTTSNSTQN